jgi:hypothetical protein
MVVGSFIPVMIINFYNRSWCFMCIPRCGKSSSPSVEIDEDDKNEKLIATDAQTSAVSKEDEIKQLRRQAELIQS